MQEEHLSDAFDILWNLWSPGEGLEKADSSTGSVWHQDWCLLGEVSSNLDKQLRKLLTALNSKEKEAQGLVAEPGGRSHGRSAQALLGKHEKR